MRKRQRSRALICLVALGILAIGVSGCAPHYRLVGNHHWSSPAPQPRDTSVDIPSNTPAAGPYGNKGPTAGNTSFAHG